MAENNWFTNMLDGFKDDPEYLTEKQILDFTAKLVNKMEELKVSRAELAKRLDVSKAFVTKLLNGNPNMTIKTMVSITHALKCSISIDIYPEGFEKRALYVYNNKNYKAYVPDGIEVQDACAA